MKGLSVGEKMALLQYHGEALAGAFRAVRSPHKDDLIEHAERALALINSIPKIEYAIDE